jgi:hypothetical protein
MVLAVRVVDVNVSGCVLLLHGTGREGLLDMALVPAAS